MTGIGSTDGGVSEVVDDEKSSPSLPVFELNPHPFLDLVCGEVVWVSMPNHQVVGSEYEKDRPWVVVTDLRFNTKLIGAVPLSSVIPPVISRPHRVFINKQDVVSTDKRLRVVDQTAAVGNVRRMSNARALARIGSLSTRAVDNIRASIGYLFGI